MPRTTERMTISLTPQRAAQLRAFAATTTDGKISPAVALLVDRACYKVDGKESAPINLT